MASGQTLWDQLIAGAGEAVTDIRQKLVEEPWYGRSLDVPTSDLAPRQHGIEVSISEELKQQPEHESGISR